MSTTVLTVNERKEAFNHHDLLVVICMATSLMRDGDDASHEVRSQWEQAIEMQAPGVVELRLDEYAGNAATREYLAAVFREIESALVACGDSVPLTHLKEVCKIPGISFDSPYPTHHLLVTVRRFLELIQATNP